MTNYLVKCLLLSALTTTTMTTTTIGQTKAIDVSADVTFRSDSNLCGVGKPNLTLKTYSRIRCASRCVMFDGCSHFNYRPKTTTCELFQLAPAYSVSELSCSLYQMKDILSMPVQIIPGIAAQNCSFPFSYNGRLHYSCVQNTSNVRDWKCMVGKRQWIACSTDVDFVATYQTVNLSIPTFVDPTPVVSINNWIVIQQRVDGTVSFNRNWAEYKAGFGDIYTNFWLGLEKMHRLTLNRVVMLRIEIQAAANGKWFSAEYDTFRITSESTGYAVYVTGYSGDAGDGFNSSAQGTKQNGKKFTTVDVDNDSHYDINCAKDNGGGGGWFNRCCFFDVNQAMNSTWFYWHLLVDLNLSPTMQLMGSRLMMKVI